MHPNINTKPRGKFFAALSASAVLALGVGACGGDDDSTSSEGGESGSVSGDISVVAYSTPQDVYEEGLGPDFQSGDGSEVELAYSFGSSGDQSRAVEAGAPADVIHLALEPDMTRVVDVGAVAEDWADQQPAVGPQTSVVAFTVRGGNPKDITEWEDLIRDDVQVVTPNPFTSGGAKWGIMAAYGQALNTGATEEEALDFVAKMLANAPVQDASASDALETFVGGEGDVLISYENEAIRAQDAGEDVEYIVPDDTIQIDTVAAVSAESQNPEAAQTFLDYLYTPEAQQIWAEAGYRPVDEGVLKQNEDKFPVPPGLFTIEDLGGWETVATEFFDSENGSIAAIESDLGQPTG